MSLLARTLIALLLLAAAPLALFGQEWTLNTAGTEVSTDKQVRILGNTLPQFTLDATNEARIQFRIGGATKFLINHDNVAAAIGTQTGGGDLRVLTNGYARTIISSLGNMVTTTGNNGYTISGEVMGSRVFSLDSGGGGYGRAAFIAANPGNSPFAIRNDPLGREYGLAGIVGASADSSGAGGRHNIGVYGYTLFNTGGTHTNTANTQTAGMFLAELGSSVTDFRSGLYGVYARAEPRAATGAFAATSIGVRAEAYGRAVDWAVGGYFTASSGAVNRGVQISLVEAGANNYSIYSEAAAKSYFAGSVGIGTTVPSAKLHVAGDILVDGNIAAKYQDVAEWVPATHDLEPGTVVVLDPTLPNHVIASTRPYDTTVAGVVSAQPGIILGEKGAAKEQIATTGRVLVRVDATAAPIRIGDLLVSSDKPGLAMKSRPIDVGGVAIHRPGTVIGKALEPLEGGVGEILVLLSLQ